MPALRQVESGGQRSHVHAETVDRRAHRLQARARGAHGPDGMIARTVMILCGLAIVAVLTIPRAIIRGLS